MRPRRGFLSGKARAIIALSALLAICAGLVACGSDTAPIVGQNCGGVSQGFRVVGDPSGPENCLWRAWERCQPATLVFTRFGTDTGETHTVTVQQNNGACEVRDAVQGYSANGGGSRSEIITYTCVGLERAPDGGLLVRACGGEGNLTIPPAEPPTTPPVPSGPMPSPT